MPCRALMYISLCCCRVTDWK